MDYQRRLKMKETRCTKCKKVIPQETIFKKSEDGKIIICFSCYNKLYGENK